MPLTRARRGAMKRNAADTAARMAAACCEFPSGGLVRITDRHAKAALRREFEPLLRAGRSP